MIYDDMEFVAIKKYQRLCANCKETKIEKKIKKRRGNSSCLSKQNKEW